MAAFIPYTPEQLANLPHDDRGPALITTTWVLTSVASVFLALRLYCKHIGRKKLWWDDWTLIAAWVRHLGSCRNYIEHSRVLG